MREVFQQELREVQERLIEIATLVSVSIANATSAFNESKRVERVTGRGSDRG
jgi:phosphate transport system protein